MRAVVLILVSIVLALFAPWRPTAADPQPPQQTRCASPHTERPFVSFPAHMHWLANFEAAAIEARRILRATKVQSCASSAAHPGEATLQRALATEPVDITDVMFQSADLRVADVRMQRHSDPRTSAASEPAAAPGPYWTLRLIRDDSDGWRVISALAFP